MEGNIDADIAEVSMEQCKNRYEEMVDRSKSERRPRPLFGAEFVVADCSRVCFLSACVYVVAYSVH